MELTVLGATGATGRELTRQALDRGHTVHAIARHPDRIELDSNRLHRATADAHNAGSMAHALQADTTVLSGLGVARGDRPGTLTAGARATVAAAPQRIIWLGAFGTGASANTAGWFTRTLLSVALRSELPDKVTADTTILQAGGTVFHAGMLTTGPLSDARRTVDLDQTPRRVFPARISRATVAAAMLDEAEQPRFPTTTAVPLSS